METEVVKVKKCLEGTFITASDIYIDTRMRECEVKVSVDEFEGEIIRKIYGNGIKLDMVDFSDIYPFKYVFSYQPV
jgi:hypothetical protein